MRCARTLPPQSAAAGFFYRGACTALRTWVEMVVSRTEALATAASCVASLRSCVLRRGLNGWAQFASDCCLARLAVGGFAYAGTRRALTTWRSHAQSALEALEALEACVASWGLASRRRAWGAWRQLLACYAPLRGSLARLVHHRVRAWHARACTPSQMHAERAPHPNARACILSCALRVRTARPAARWLAGGRPSRRSA